MHTEVHKSRFFSLQYVQEKILSGNFSYDIFKKSLYSLEDVNFLTAVAKNNFVTKRKSQ